MGLLQKLRKARSGGDTRPRESTNEAKARTLANPPDSTVAALAKSVKQRNIPISRVSCLILPDSHRFEGSKVVNGKFCDTVGKYRKELNRTNTDMGGWSG